MARAKSESVIELISACSFRRSMLNDAKHPWCSLVRHGGFVLANLLERSPRRQVAVESDLSNLSMRVAGRRDKHHGNKLGV
jgi:hypothetical protein